jgi:hypothetical protein
LCRIGYVNHVEKGIYEITDKGKVFYAFLGDKILIQPVGILVCGKVEADLN